MKSTYQLAALERGELDIGFVWALPDRPSALLEFERIWDEPLMLALPSKHPRAIAPQMLTLQDLTSEAFVTVSRNCGALFFRTITALCRSAGFTPEIAYEAPDLVTVLGLVASGAGVAIVPAAMRRLQTPGVTYRSLANDGHRSQLHWVSRREANLPLVPLMRKAMFETASRQPI
jgi:DNA-binding transcriptional LysR family regulator